MLAAAILGRRLPSGRIDDVYIASLIHRMTGGGSKPFSTHGQELSRLRAAVERRDAYTCRLCGYGRRDDVELKLSVFWELPLSPRSLITVCARCAKTARGVPLEADHLIALWCWRRWQAVA